jgi:hypothetical protein
MKKTILSLLLIASTMLLHAQCNAQNCIKVDSAKFTNPSGDNVTWKLTIYWSASGTKHLNTIITNAGDTVLNTCNEVRAQGNSSGTIVYNNIITTGGSLMLRSYFTRWTGTCGNGTICDSSQSLIFNVLPIKVEYITARNVDNSTLITFKVGAVEDGKNEITVMYQMRNGSTKKRVIELPDEMNPGDIWMVTINNITNTYTTKKL